MWDTSVGLFQSRPKRAQGVRFFFFFTGNQSSGFCAVRKVIPGTRKNNSLCLGPADDSGLVSNICIFHWDLAAEIFATSTACLFLNISSLLTSLKESSVYFYFTTQIKYALLVFLSFQCWEAIPQHDGTTTMFDCMTTTIIILMLFAPYLWN